MLYVPIPFFFSPLSNWLWKWVSQSFFLDYTYFCPCIVTFCLRTQLFMSPLSENNRSLKLPFLTFPPRHMSWKGSYTCCLRFIATSPTLATSMLSPPGSWLSNHWFCISLSSVPLLHLHTGWPTPPCFVSSPRFRNSSLFFPLILNFFGFVLDLLPFSTFYLLCFS